MYSNFVAPAETQVASLLDKVFTEYDSSTGVLSNDVGAEYIKVVALNFPLQGVDEVNDNKITIVLDDDEKSVMITSGVFLPSLSTFPLVWPVIGGTGIFRGLTEVSINTDGTAFWYDFN